MTGGPGASLAFLQRSVIPGRLEETSPEPMTADDAERGGTLSSLFWQLSVHGFRAPLRGPGMTAMQNVPETQASTTKEPWPFRLRFGPTCFKPSPALQQDVKPKRVER
jgi:hypothetical protein